MPGFKFKVQRAIGFAVFHWFSYQFPSDAKKFTPISGICRVYLTQNFNHTNWPTKLPELN